MYKRVCVYDVKKFRKTILKCYMTRNAKTRALTPPFAKTI